MSSKRVFVLGAGISIGSGIPAMNALTKRVFSDPYHLGLHDRLTHFCAFAFPNLDMSLDMDGIVNPGPEFDMNIEEFMSALDAYEAYSRNTTLSNLPFRSDQLVSKLLTMIGSCIMDLSKEPGPQEYYLNFVRSLKPGDSVITFNWDSLFEMACDQAGVRWSFPDFQTRHGDLNVKFDPDSVTLIKIHGSVDWRLARTVDEFDRVLYSVNDVPQVVSSKSPLKQARPKHLGGGYFTEESGDVPYIIPPSHFKNFTWRGLSGALWSAAMVCLNWAEQLSIIGYSLPRTDYLPRWLLRTGLMFNHHTNREFVKLFWGCRNDNDLEFNLQGMPLSDHINELQAQAFLLGDQNIMQQWNRSVIKVIIVNPDSSMEAHFKRSVTSNIEFIAETAETYFLKEGKS